MRQGAEVGRFTDVQAIGVCGQPRTGRRKVSSDMFSGKRRACRVAVMAGTVTLLFVGLPAAVGAAPGVGTIGPGLSSNTAGVRCVQAALKIPVDGSFGQQTYEAVKNFQRQHPPLSVDGAVGKATGDVLLPYAPDGCIAHIPSTYSTPQWVSSPTPGRPISTAELRTEADRFMNMDYPTFLATKRNAPNPAFDWTDNGCSGPPIVREVYRDLFNGPCEQHDFGYRNYGSDNKGLQLSPIEDTRNWIDGRFLEEMKRMCDNNFTDWWESSKKGQCLNEANAVWGVVRHKGRSHFH